jgi:hypothetical protein
MEEEEVLIEMTEEEEYFYNLIMGRYCKRTQLGDS